MKNTGLTAIPTAGGSNEFIDQVNDTLRTYDRTINEALTRQGLTGLNLTVEKMAKKLGYRYDDVKTDKKKVIEILFEYFDKTKIPNEISQRERLKNELINTLPAKESKDDFLRAQQYLQQNRAELKKIKELKGKEMSFKQWVQTVSSSNPEMPFELSPGEMYEILKELQNNGTITTNISNLEFIKKAGKKGKLSPPTSVTEGFIST